MNLLPLHIDHVKKVILTLVLGFSFAIIHAQAPQANKVVHLRSGTTIKGTVIASDTVGYIIVMDKRSEMHYYDTATVERIDEGNIYQRHFDLKPKGYICNIELGGSNIIPSRAGGTNVPGFYLDVVNSYQFSPYISLGLGVGTQLSGSGHNIEMLSVYADTRIYFMESNVGPFLDLAIGYSAMFMKYADYDSFNLTPTAVREFNNGMMFNPSLGIRISLGREVAMTVDMGYRLNYLQAPNNIYYLMSRDATFIPDAHSYYSFSAITLKAGFQF